MKTWRVIAMYSPRDFYSDEVMDANEWVKKERKLPDGWDDMRQNRAELLRSATAAYGKIGNQKDLVSSVVFYDFLNDSPAFLFKEDNNGNSYIVIERPDDDIGADIYNNVEG